ncbi:PDDEXK nuclease domain-containing protein [uncultured Parabacteroides sp.]|jgi:predicted nuclease of restriction endonuclease-like (RecB) superfamily|uniref:PDDEXK nuclease domain-containing protein n=1 Tax=uncultured Parabacteroides sp. TaxID=512312 RepID=UPI0025E951E5|nr:PDDEXK nuclease domain-containing protein [uncultured Parabacteroides sp.]
MENNVIIDLDFKQWVQNLKEQIKQAQIKAAVKVNGELLHLYWTLGYEITLRYEDAKYGSAFFNTLSRELLSDFPNMKGFSETNLKYIRRWYMFYNQDDVNRPQLVDDFEDVFFAVPWGHHRYIIEKCKDRQEAFFYIRKTVENNWSRSVLLNFLDTDLYERQGRSVNNFGRLLPVPQSDLAEQIIKDPYNFDFLTLTENYCELELEEALINNMTKFLLELGQGFAYVGKQVPLEVGGDTYFADLLFYHLELRCYVVVELKACKFHPAFVGQLGMYVSAINHLKKKEIDAPTIGLIICKTKNTITAQYALESSSQPIGISEYQFSTLIPEDFKSRLPSIEEIESSLKGNDD